MIKKVSGSSLVVVCIFFITSSVAYAELYLSAGIPVFYSFSGNNSDGTKFEVESVNGRLFHVGIPSFLGVGYEFYEVSISNSNYVYYDQTVAITLYDVFYVLPIPDFILTLGAGIGTAEFKCTQCSTYFNKGQATKLFGQIGYPFASNLDAHVSYQMIYAEIKAKTSSYKAKVGGSMIALGIGVSF